MVIANRKKSAGDNSIVEAHSSRGALGVKENTKLGKSINNFKKITKDNGSNLTSKGRASKLYS